MLTRSDRVRSRMRSTSSRTIVAELLMSLTAM
jgi:hypothetical protein